MKPADLLLGRKTFDIFAGSWPEHEAEWPGINDVTKYVLSGTLKSPHWKNSVMLAGAAEIKVLKNSEGSDIRVHGSASLIQLLLANDPVDGLWFKNSSGDPREREKTV